MTKRKKSKIWIFSDIHADKHEDPWEPYAPDHDIVIAAGDILEDAKSSIDYLADLTDRPILFVLGNHEFYHNDWHKEIEVARLHSLNYPNIYFLENNAVVINDITFIGSTLWTDLDQKKSGLATGIILEKKFRDLNVIYNKKKKITAKDWYERHIESCDFIKKAIDEKTTEKTIVISHHAPLKESLHSDFATSSFNAGFISDLPELVEKTNLWVHGHTHSCWDYMHKNTRVICNPRGYEGEYHNFKERLVIEF